MSMTTMTQVGKLLNVPSAKLSYWYKAGRLTGVPVGGVVLMDPEQVRKELTEIGFFQRREQRGEARRRIKAKREAEAVK